MVGHGNIDDPSIVSNCAACLSDAANSTAEQDERLSMNLTPFLTRRVQLMSGTIHHITHSSRRPFVTYHLLILPHKWQRGSRQRPNR